MSAIIKELKDVTDNFENTITECLGFELPEDITFDDALDLLHCIEEPLHSELKNILFTRADSTDSYNLRWLIIGSIMSFNIKFGPAFMFSEKLKKLYYEALSELSDKVFELTNDPERLPVDRYGYLKTIVCTFNKSFNNYSDINPVFLTSANFNSAIVDHSNCCSGDILAGLSESITKTAKEQLQQSHSFNIVNDNIRYITSAEGLKEAKKKFGLLTKIIVLFDELLTTKFK